MAIEIKSGDILNSDQLSKHIKVYAGPGAGKTHFLVENVKNIVRTNEKITRSKSRKVLCITYTNAAVDEIKKRLDQYSDAVEVSTIHGFIIDNIIVPFQEDLKNVIVKDFNISVPTSAKITTQIEGLGILHGHDRNEIYEFINEEAGTSEEIDYSKKVMGEVEVDNDLYLFERKIELKASQKIDPKYILSIKKYTWTKVCKLTHNEILYFGYRILQENSTIAYALRVKFPFVFVDEFQDTNPLQTLIVSLLGEKSTTLGLIGDVAQSIYSFQGAKPSQFLNFSTLGDKELIEYSITGNRRSTQSIVSICNFFRKADSLSQASIKPYIHDLQKAEVEAIPVTFIIGETPNSIAAINEIVQCGGVVMTRTWAAAFDYIQGINDEQKKALKKIYNSYFISPIDIRAEIAEHNNVTWVRTFKFLIILYDAYLTGSFLDILAAFSLYLKIDNLKKAGVFSTALILSVKKLLNNIFVNITNTTLIVDIISKFNAELSKAEFEMLRSALFTESEFELQCFTEFDDKIVEPLSSIEWYTAQKLFKEVFSKDSKYMTVHQAKGLEWDKVIVSVNPTRNDKTTLANLFTNPQILQEIPEEEFTRIFYVACSRAKEKLYIHLPDDEKLVALIQKSLDVYQTSNSCILKYEFLR